MSAHEPTARREFPVTGGAFHNAAAIDGSALLQPAGTSSEDGNQVSVSLTVNGQAHTLSLDPRMTLLDALRERLHLTGTKKGCDHGQCGACTVLINGVRVNSCLSFAVMHEGCEITTIEGLAAGEQLHPVQAAFLEHDAFQCGYCTPGQIVSAAALLSEPGEASEKAIRENMSGNLCRCGAYPNIVAAVRQVLANRERKPA